MSNPSVPLTGERADLLEALAAHRGFLRHTVQGLTDDQARQRTTVSELTLGGLIKHVSATESGWADFVVDGPAAIGGGDEWSGEPDPAAVEAYLNGFRLLPDETLADVLAATTRSPRAPTSWSAPSTSTRPTRCPPHRGSRPAPPAAPVARSCTSSPRPPSTPATPTSSARASTARRRWAERTSSRDRLRSNGLRSAASGPAPSGGLSAPDVAVVGWPLVSVRIPPPPAPRALQHPGRFSTRRLVDATAPKCGPDNAAQVVTVGGRFAGIRAPSPMAPAEADQG